ncbi:hypothetical protein GGF46_002289 [Coemansia sp. RSA 552]|nr:hypothetical protein GGF46_002289 [Coemansia sp. RSA 552]
MDNLKPVLESGRIDFAGQSLAGQVSTVGVGVAGAMGFVVGGWKGSLAVCFGTFLLGVLVIYAAVLPPWPHFRRNRQKWLTRTDSSSAQGAGPPRRTLVEDVSDDSEGNP